MAKPTVSSDDPKARTTLKGTRAHLAHPDIEQVTLCGRLIYTRHGVTLKGWCAACEKEANK